MKYSIKTVDGSRFDYETKPGEEDSLMNFIKPETVFLGMPIDGGTKYFNLRNIVSITERQE